MAVQKNCLNSLAEKTQIGPSEMCWKKFPIFVIFVQFPHTKITSHIVLILDSRLPIFGQFWLTEIFF